MESCCSLNALSLLSWLLSAIDAEGSGDNTSTTREKGGKGVWVRGRVKGGRVKNVCWCVEIVYYKDVLRRFVITRMCNKGAVLST